MKFNMSEEMDKYCGGEYEDYQAKQRKKMPVMECLDCNADFYYLGKSKIKEGSYFFNEDEPNQ